MITQLFHIHRSTFFTLYTFFVSHRSHKSHRERIVYSRFPPSRRALKKLAKQDAFVKLKVSVSATDAFIPRRPLTQHGSTFSRPSKGFVTPSDGSFTVQRSTFNVLYSLYSFIVQRSPFIIHRSSFTVHRSTFTFLQYTHQANIK